MCISPKKISKTPYNFNYYPSSNLFLVYPRLRQAAYSNSMVPGGFEVLERQCQLELRDHKVEGFLLTGHRRHGTRPRPGCRWCAKHPRVDGLVT